MNRSSFENIVLLLKKSIAKNKIFSNVSFCHGLRTAIVGDTGSLLFNSILLKTDCPSVFAYRMGTRTITWSVLLEVNSLFPTNYRKKSLPRILSAHFRANCIPLPTKISIQKKLCNRNVSTWSILNLIVKYQIVLFLYGGKKEM